MALTPIESPSRQPSSFTCFSLLAPELRRHIWTLCLPTQRVISISYVGRASCTNYRISSPAPVLLYINQESRSFALERYEQYFLQSWPYLLINQRPSTTDCSWHDQHYAWVDMGRDILFYENDFYRISSSQWLRARVTRPGGAHNEEHKKNTFLRSHEILSSWMVQSKPGGRVDSVIAQNEKGDDDSTFSTLQHVARIAIPFDEIYVGPNKSSCGTGYGIKLNRHQKIRIDLRCTLEKYFSSLRDLIVVVDKERKDAKRKESEEMQKERDKEWIDLQEDDKNQIGKGRSEQVSKRLFGFDFDRFLDDSICCLPTGCTSGKNVEFIDFRPSERYDSYSYMEMEKEVRNWFRNMGEGDSKPWSASAVILMEVRPKQEQKLDFTWLPPTK